MLMRAVAVSVRTLALIIMRHIAESDAHACCGYVTAHRYALWDYGQLSVKRLLSPKRLK